MKKANTERDCFIWTPDGVWFQHLDGEGLVHSSWLGKISLQSVQIFAQDRKIPFIIHRPRVAVPA